VKVTTHLHLVPSSRMSGAKPLLTLYAFLAWTGRNLNAFTTFHWGARGQQALAQSVGALRYKPEGRGFDTRWYHCHHSGHTLALGSTRPLNRSEYQKYTLGGNSGQCLGLTTLLSSCAYTGIALPCSARGRGGALKG